MKQKQKTDHMKLKRICIINRKLGTEVRKNLQNDRTIDYLYAKLNRYVLILFLNTSTDLL